MTKRKNLSLMILILMFIASICMVFMSNKVSALTAMGNDIYKDRGFALSDMAYTNVCKDKIATVTDYNGNALDFGASPHSNDDVKANPKLGYLTDGVCSSWHGCAPVKNGSNVLGWFTIDFGANYYIDSVVISLTHDWVSIDVVVQIAQDSAFTKGVRTISNNDIDNSLGLGETCTMDSSVPVAETLSNFTNQDFGHFAGVDKWIENNGTGFILESAVYGRYIRVTNNAQARGFSAVQEIICNAPISHNSSYGRITGGTIRTTNVNGTKTGAPSLTNAENASGDWNATLQDNSFDSAYSAKLTSDGWVVLDLGASYWIDRIDIGLYWNWAFSDVIIQASRGGLDGYGFIAAENNVNDVDLDTIFSNDYDNTYGYGFGSICTNEIIVASSGQWDWADNLNVTGSGAVGSSMSQSGQTFLFAPIYTRYIRYRSSSHNGNNAVISEFQAYGSSSQMVGEVLNNVANPITATYALKDYSGNELTYLAGINSNQFGDRSGTNAASIFGSGLHSAYNCYCVRSSSSGANQKAWLEIDLQRTFAIHEIDFSFYWDWNFDDVIIQTATKADFSDAFTILNTDMDNSTGTNPKKEFKTYDGSKLTDGSFNTSTGVLDHDAATSGSWYNPTQLIAVQGGGGVNTYTSGYAASNGHRMLFHDRPIRARYVRITNNRHDSAGYSVFGGVKILAAERNGIVSSITDMPADTIALTAGETLNLTNPIVNYFGWMPGGVNFSETVIGKWVSYDSTNPFNKDLVGTYQLMFVSDLGLSYAVGLADKVITVNVQLSSGEFDSRVETFENNGINVEDIGDVNILNTNYGRMTSAQQEATTKKPDLDNIINKVIPVVQQIDGIGTVSDASKASKISAANTAYNALTDALKLQVGNRVDLHKSVIKTGVYEKQAANDYTMRTGASIRYSDPSGIRFAASFDKTTYEAYKSSGYSIEVGMIVAPKDLADQYGALTLENANTATKYSKVVGDANKLFATTENGVQRVNLYVAMVNIKLQNYTREFVANGYMKFTKTIKDVSGANVTDTVIIYSEVPSDNQRSIYDVAAMALTDKAYVKGTTSFNCLLDIVNKVNANYEFTISGSKASAKLKANATISKVFAPKYYLQVVENGNGTYTFNKYTVTSWTK